MSKTQEFIFEFVRRNYEREEQGSEAILRTLPFFATSLGALLAGLAVMGARVESLPPGRVWLAFELLGLVLALALISIGCILASVLATKEIRLISDEITIVERAQLLDSLHVERASSASGMEIDAFVLFDLRDQLIQEMSVAAGRNRLANVRRMWWLKGAIAALAVALTIAFVTMFSVLLASNPRVNHGSEPSAAGSRPGNNTQSSTAATANMGPSAGRPVLPPSAAH